MDNYKIYMMVDKRTNNPVYIGQTKRSVYRRMHKHFTDTNDPLYGLCDAENWEEKYEIKILMEDITDKRWATDVESKYIQEYLSKGYALLNKGQVNNPTDVKVNLHKINHWASKRIICINTGKKYNSINEAAEELKIYRLRIRNACKYGYSAGVDKNNQPLFWKYADGTKYIQKKEKWTVYKIEQLQENDWIPIYIGQTKTALSQRLSNHLYQCANSGLQEIVEQYPLEERRKNFRIMPVIENIATLDKAIELEAKTTDEYKEKYKLYNLRSGNEINEHMRESTSHSSAKFWQSEKGNKLRQYIKENNTGSNSIHAVEIECIETGEKFGSVVDAANKYNIHKSAIAAVLKTKDAINNLHFEYVDKTLYERYRPTFYIYTLEYQNKTVYFYTRMCIDNNATDVMLLKRIISKAIPDNIDVRKDCKVNILYKTYDIDDALKKLEELYDKYKQYTNFTLLALKKILTRTKIYGKNNYQEDKMIYNCFIAKLNDMPIIISYINFKQGHKLSLSRCKSLLAYCKEHNLCVKDFSYEIFYESEDKVDAYKACENKHNELCKKYPKLILSKINVLDKIPCDILKKDYEYTDSSSNNTKKVKCITTNTIFPSLKIAAEKTGMAMNTIKGCCNGHKKTAGTLESGERLTWQYL